MMFPPGYRPPVNYALAAARRFVIERAMELRGLTRGTPKFDEVVRRHTSRIAYHRNSRWDALIDPRVLEFAREGRYPPEVKKRPSKTRKKR